MQRTKIKCPLCGQEISKSNYTKHQRRHENHPETFNENAGKYKLNHDGLICQFCGKECKNRNSLCNHERLCKENPDRQLTKYEKYGYVLSSDWSYKAWNYGLTKETDERVAKSSQTYLKNYSEGKFIVTGKANSKEKEVLRKNKLSKYAKEENNFWKYRKKHLLEYNGTLFDSSYETKLAKDLDNNNIQWEKPGSFHYMDLVNGKEHSYTPDFYLPEYDIYLDPKNDFLIENINPNLGYKDVDKIKWVMEQNNIRIFILNKDQLSWNYIKNII